MMFPVLQWILPDPDRLVIIEPCWVLETVGRYQDVIKELQTDVDTLAAAALDLAHQDLLQVGSEDQHPEPDSGVGGSVT